jgi:hypothetical protein
VRSIGVGRDQGGNGIVECQTAFAQFVDKQERLGGVGAFHGSGMVGLGAGDAELGCGNRRLRSRCSGS